MPDSTPSQASPSPARTDQPGPDRPFDRENDPFYLSPTWTWPVFDPECCQECGRVIPLHETGWILRDSLDEIILCEECFEILDELRNQREAIMESAAPPPPAASQAPERVNPEPPPSPPSPPPAEPAFELTAPPAFIPRPCFAGIEIESSPAAIAADNGPTLFELPPEPADVGEPAIVATAEPAPQPAFELTPPPAFQPRPCFATIAMQEPPPAPESEIDGAPLLFDFVASAPQSAEAPATEPAEPLTAEIAEAAPEVAADPAETIADPASHEPAFVLTPPPFEPRSCFASTVMNVDPPAIETAIDDSPSLFDTVADEVAPTHSIDDAPTDVVVDAPTESIVPAPADALVEAPLDAAVEAESPPLEPAFVLTPPPAFTPRLCFAPFVPADETSPTQTPDDSSTLFDAIESTPAAAEPPKPDPVEADECPVDVSTEAPAEAPVEAPVEPTPVAPPLAESPLSEPVPGPRFELTEPPAFEPRPRFALFALSEPEPIVPVTGNASPSLFETPTNETPPPTPPPVAPSESNDPAATAEPAQPIPHPGKARARKARLPAIATAPPLSFVHPVDALLTKLHHERVDTQVWNALKRWRSVDPLHREVEAMLVIAVELRDRWMARSDGGQSNRSIAG